MANTLGLVTRGEVSQTCAWHREKGASGGTVCVPVLQTVSGYRLEIRERPDTIIESTLYTNLNI